MLYFSSRPLRTLMCGLLVVGGLLVSSPSRVLGADPNEWISQSLPTVGVDPESQGASISAGGRFLVYDSDSDELVNNLFTRNLLDGDNGSTDVFLYDRATGEAERVSVSDLTNEPGDKDSRHPQVSEDGRYVIFASDATNLVKGDTNGKRDIFVRDRLLRRTFRVSQPNDPTQEANGESDYPALNSGGTFVAYTTEATNITASPDTNANADVIRARLGVPGSNEYVSVTNTPDRQLGNSYSFDPKFNGDGEVVSFTSDADNLGDTRDRNGFPDVFVRDMRSARTERVSVPVGGVGDADRGGRRGSVSEDGQYVAYQSEAKNIVPGDTNNASDVFVYDRLRRNAQRVSLSSAGSEANDDSLYPTISASGKMVVFSSSATNLVSPTVDTNGKWQDVFVHNLDSGVTEAVSITPRGETPSRGTSTTHSRDRASENHYQPVSVDRSGRFIAFSAFRSNGELTTPFDDDAAAGEHVYLRDMQQKGCKPEAAAAAVPVCRSAK